jgi:hypothetical protein
MADLMPKTVSSALLRWPPKMSPWELRNGMDSYSHPENEAKWRWQKSLCITTGWQALLILNT